MTSWYEYVGTLKYNKEWLLAQAEAEASLGLKNSFFLIKDGMASQYVDGEEAEVFSQMVKDMKEEEFNDICNKFFDAIDKKDKVEMFKALTIFDEMDRENLGTDAMKRRLKRVREATHTISYEI